MVLIKNHMLIEFWKKIHNIVVKIQILFAYQVVAQLYFDHILSWKTILTPFLIFKILKKTWFKHFVVN